VTENRNLIGDVSVGAQDRLPGMSPGAVLEHDAEASRRLGTTMTRVGLTAPSICEAWVVGYRNREGGRSGPHWDWDGGGDSQYHRWKEPIVWFYSSETGGIPQDLFDLLSGGQRGQLAAALANGSADKVSREDLLLMAEGSKRAREAKDMVAYLALPPLKVVFPGWVDTTDWERIRPFVDGRRARVLEFLEILGEDLRSENTLVLKDSGVWLASLEGLSPEDRGRLRSGLSSMASGGKVYERPGGNYLVRGLSGEQESVLPAYLTRMRVPFRGDADGGVETMGISRKLLEELRGAAVAEKLTPGKDLNEELPSLGVLHWRC